MYKIQNRVKVVGVKRAKSDSIYGQMTIKQSGKFYFAPKNNDLQRFVSGDCYCQEKMSLLLYSTLFYRYSDIKRINIIFASSMLKVKALFLALKANPFCAAEYSVGFF